LPVMTWQCQTCGKVHTSPDLLALLTPPPHLARMNDSTDPITRLNAALEGRYLIERERELGEGGMATAYLGVVSASVCTMRRQTDASS